MKAILIILTALGALVQQTCTASTSGAEMQRAAMQEMRVPGIIDYSNDRSQDVLKAPTVVRLGEEFQVTINTFGGGCERAGDTSVLVSDTGATIMVYDFTTAIRPGIACTMVLKRMPHVVPMRITQPGEAVIRIWGRRIGSDTPPVGVPTVIEHRIQVSADRIGQQTQPAPAPSPDRPPLQYSQPAPNQPVAGRWTVSETGIGPIRIGMTILEAETALQESFKLPLQAGTCYNLKPSRMPSGTSLMIVDGQIVRVDVETPQIATDVGARVGDSEGKIRSLYPETQTAPHKYVQGFYLTVRPAGNYRIVFETQNGKVTRFRAGRMPEVGWVEGCA